MLKKKKKVLFNQSDSVGGTELCNALRCDIFARSAILINTALVLSLRMKLTLTYLILFMFRRSPSVVSAFCVQHLNPEKERRKKKKNSNYNCFSHHTSDYGYD